jgi:hypothetical protein
MKKLTNQLLVLFFIIATIGCNKREVLTVESESKKDSYAIPVLVADSKSLKNGVLVGSKKELLNIISTDGVSAVKSASNVNKVFVPTGTGTTDPRDPFDPTLDCWEEINAIYEQLYPEALVIANRYCREVLLCIGCPDGGLVATMVVKPTSIKCIQVLEAESQISVFSVSGGFDGKDIVEYINRSASKY